MRIFLPLVSTGDRARATVCSRSPKRRSQVNLCTYNIGYEGDRVSAGWRAAQIVGQYDGGRDVEIAALQEVVQRAGTDTDELAALRNLQARWQVFSAPHNTLQDYRNAILSVHRFVQGSGLTHVIDTGGSALRTNLSVQVQHPSVGRLRVFCIHTRANAAMEGVRQSLTWVRSVTLREQGVPFVVMGDFNARYTDVMEVAKNVGLRLQGKPVARIDHILVNGFSVDEACLVTRPVWEGQHDPVFATAGLP